MADIIYTVIENGVVVETIVADDESVELGGKSKALTRLAALRKSAIIRGRVRTVLDSGDFSLRNPNLSEVDNAYKGMWLVLLNNKHKFVPRRIGRYKGATKRVQFTGTNRAGPFPNTVEPGDRWMIIDRDPRDNT
jgi:hypothetical protein